MKSTFYLLLLLAIVSCTETGEEKNKEEVLSETAQVLETEEDAEVQEFTTVDTTAFDLSLLSHQGEVIMRKFWLDATGENIVLFTGEEDLEKGEATIFAYHYVASGGKAKLLKDMTASVFDCADADLFLDFDERAFSISDLDQNNIGEITFAYRMACVTDVSPHDLVLHIFENSQDFSLVGNTEVQIGPEDRIGGKVTETNFDGAAASFLTAAHEVWEEIKQY